MAENQELRTIEGAALWTEYRLHKSHQLRDQLIERYLPLVKLVAGRIAIGLPQFVEREELISNGFFGLLDAIERFDPARGIKFETYASARIRGSILDAVRAQDWVPASVRQKARHYEKTVAELESTLGRSAQDAEIAVAMNISMEQFHHLVTQISGGAIVPLDEFLDAESGTGHSENPTQSLENEEAKAILAKAIDRLPEKERLVVALYYYEGLTLKEISLIMKLSEARICQLHTKAIFRLRGALSRLRSALL